MFKREPPAPASIPSKTSCAPRAFWIIPIACGIGLVACGSDGGPGGTGNGGTTSASPGGAPGTAGTSIAAGGTSTTGTGGASGGAGAGGMTTTGGAGAGGMTTTGGAGAGGMTTTGGAATGGAATGGATTGGASSSGGTGGATCQKGTTMGKEVLFIGESFVAMGSIPEETTKLARAAGSLAANDSYVDKSVSGTWIGNGAANSIPNQYKDNASGVRFVLMDGGGNDCWQGGQASHRTAALSAAEKLFQDMATNGVKKVVYFFYPDPIGSQYASLTECLNLLRPAMKSLCDKQTSPKCYWVDLRSTWNGHPEYTSDGIHVAGPGNAPTAAAIFKSMVDNCVAP